MINPSKLLPRIAKAKRFWLDQSRSIDVTEGREKARAVVFGLNQATQIIKEYVAEIRRERQKG